MTPAWVKLGSDCALDIPKIGELDLSLIGDEKILGADIPMDNVQRLTCGVIPSGVGIMESAADFKHQKDAKLKGQFIFDLDHELPQIFCHEYIPWQ